MSSDPDPIARLSTLDLLDARKRAASKPGHRDDGRFLALVIEGGGMRGVVSAGMVAALEELGLRDCFDAVYGSSAGAISGAYFLAGQARYGSAIYEDINNRKFINLWRLPQGTPVVSLDYLLDDVCVRQKPLMFDRVLKSDIPLRVLAASINRKRAVTLKDFTTQRDLLDALRASARIPYFAGAPVHYREDRFLDASMYVSIPFQAAMDDNATDLVILLTRPLGGLRRSPTVWDRHLVAPYLKRIDPALPSHYMARAATYRAEIDAIQNHRKSGNLPRMTLVHLPEEAENVAGFELSQEKLLAGAKAGVDAVYSALGLARSETGSEGEGKDTILHWYLPRSSRNEPEAG